MKDSRCCALSGQPFASLWILTCTAMWKLKVCFWGWKHFFFRRIDAITNVSVDTQCAFSFTWVFKRIVNFVHWMEFQESKSKKYKPLEFNFIYKQFLWLRCVKVLRRKNAVEIRLKKVFLETVKFSDKFRRFTTGLIWFNVQFERLSTLWTLVNATILLFPCSFTSCLPTLLSSKGVMREFIRPHMFNSLM